MDYQFNRFRDPWHEQDEWNEWNEDAQSVKEAHTKRRERKAKSTPEIKSKDEANTINNNESSANPGIAADSTNTAKTVAKTDQQQTPKSNILPGNEKKNTTDETKSAETKTSNSSLDLGGMGGMNAGGNESNSSPAGNDSIKPVEKKNTVLKNPASDKAEAKTQLKQSQEETMKGEMTEAEAQLPVKAKHEHGKPMVLSPKDPNKTFKSKTGLPGKQKTEKKEEKNPAEIAEPEKKRQDNDLKAANEKLKDLSGAKAGEKTDTEQENIQGDKKISEKQDAQTETQLKAGEEAEKKSDEKKEQQQSKTENLGGMGAMPVSPGPAADSTMTSAEQLPTVSQEFIESQKAAIFLQAEIEKANVQLLTQAKVDEVTQLMQQERDSFKQEIAALKKDLSADYKAQKQVVKNDAASARKTIDAQYKIDLNTLETTTGSKKKELNKSAEDRKKDFLSYVELQKQEPYNIAKAEGDRVDKELNDASNKALTVGQNVARKYPGQDGNRPDMRQASNDVAKGAHDEMQDKKGSMRSDLMDRAAEFDGGFDQYTTDVISQIDSVKSQIEPQLDQLKTQSKQGLDQLYKSITASIDIQEKDTIATLQKQEKAELLKLTQTEQRMEKRIAATQAETITALQQGELLVLGDIDQQASAAAAEFIAQPGIPESEYQNYTSESIASLQQTSAEYPGNQQQVVDMQVSAIQAEITAAKESSTQQVENVKKSNAKIVAAIKTAMTKAKTDYKTKAKEITDKLPKSHDELLKGAFTEVDKAIVDRKARLKATNDKFRGELKTETDDNLVSAKAPLTDDLYARCDEAAQEMDKSWWEAVLDAIVSVVTGLLVVLLIAMILVAAGLCSTILGAMLLIGAIMMAVTFITSLVTRLMAGQGWMGLVYSITDAFGVTGIIESITGYDSYDTKFEHKLSDYQRTKRGTEGVINFAMIIFGARGAKGGRPGGGGFKGKFSFMTDRVGEFNNKRIGGWLEKSLGDSFISKGYKFLSEGTMRMENFSIAMFDAMNKGINKVVGGIKDVAVNSFKGVKEVVFGKKSGPQYSGGKGEYSGRDYNPNNAGGPVRKLSFEKIKFTRRGVDVVKQHLSRFGKDTANYKMLLRLEKILAGEIAPTAYDRAFYSHELREFVRYRSSGHKTGDPGYDFWNDAHTATLEDYQLSDYNAEGQSNIYHPETVTESPVEISDKQWNDLINNPGQKEPPSTNNSTYKGGSGKNLQKISDSYLKERGIDAHELKKEYLGQKAEIAKFDLYVDKDTRQILIYRKNGVGEPIETSEYID